MPLLVNNFNKINWSGILKKQKYLILDWFYWEFLLLIYLFKIYVSDHSPEHWISSYIKYFQRTKKCTFFVLFLCVIHTSSKYIIRNTELLSRSRPAQPKASLTSSSSLKPKKHAEGFFGSMGGKGVGQQRVEGLEEEGGEKQDREGV